MFTPLEKRPPMPDHIQNERCVELGLEIEKLLKNGTIRIEAMDETGFLHISV